MQTFANNILYSTLPDHFRRDSAYLITHTDVITRMNVIIVQNQLQVKVSTKILCFAISWAITNV